MASGFMPAGFWEVVKPVVPEDQPVGAKGGRPRVLNEVVLPVIWYVLTTGIRWQDVLASMGCSGRTAHRRLRQWQALGIWDALHQKLLALLNGTGKLNLEVVVIDSTMGPAPATRPGPTPPIAVNPARNTRCWWTATVSRWFCTAAGPTPATKPRSSRSSSSFRK